MRNGTENVANVGGMSCEKREETYEGTEDAND